MANNSIEKLDFDNTEIAFDSKSDKELKEVKWLFRMMNNSFLVNLGSKLTPLAFKLRLPINRLIKRTIFKQFVGGETLVETQSDIDLLQRYNTLTILDYGAEAKSSDEDLDLVVKETLNAIEFAASNSSVPAVISKVTGLVSDDILLKMQAGTLLMPEEEVQKEKLFRRIDTICNKAHAMKVSIMIDAEESWYQDAIDMVAEKMMAKYNQESVIVFNTYQLYRHDKLNDLKTAHQKAQEAQYLLGAKVVRGAYMEKENNYAQEKGLPTPINPTKDATDKQYDAAIMYCLDNHEGISFVCATHNTKSTLQMTKIIEQKGLNKQHPHLNFSQLYGMSDNLTFNLAKAGYNVAKYMPYGPIKEVIPYLIRRAQENTAVTSDMSRELTFIQKEIKRRGL